MNTHAHAVVTVALLGRTLSRRELGALFLGSVLPDLQIFGFYLREKLRGTPEQVIWDLNYFAVHHNFDWLNSIPLAALGLLIARLGRWRVAQALFAGLLLHCLLDLPFHNIDAHRHFLPFSSWRFISPISYWDPKHFGIAFTVVEMFVALGACAVLWRRHEGRWARFAIGAVPVIYVVGGAFIAWLVLTGQFTGSP